MDLIVSIGCIILTISISQFLRQFARDKLSEKGLLRKLFLEFVASFEMTAVAFECSVVFRIGGLRTLAVFIFCIRYWRTKNWQEVSANPCSYMADWVTQKIQLKALILTVVSQLAGGFASYRYYNTLYWRLGLSDSHLARLNAGLQPCASRIQVSPLLATTVEACGSLVILMFAKLIGRARYLRRVARFLKAFLGTFVKLLAFDKSGGFFNPIRASAVQYGCTGSTLFEHAQVYWVGNTLGTLAACYADKVLNYSSTAKPRDGSVGTSRKERKVK